MARSTIQNIISRQLTAPGAARLTISANWVGWCGADHALEVAAAIATELARSSFDDLAGTEQWIETLDEGPMKLYLSAAMASAKGDVGEAALRWNRLLARVPWDDPMLILDYARAVLASNDPEESLRIVRRAFQLRPAYSFYSRGEGFFSKLEDRLDNYLRECRIAVLGSGTWSLLLPVLKAHLLRYKIKASTYEGLFGALTQETLDPNSGLSQFKPQIVFLMSSWRELGLTAITRDEDKFIRELIRGKLELWNRLLERFGCHVIQQAYDLPSAEAYGYLSNILPGGRLRVIEKINSNLSLAAPASVSVLDTAALQRAHSADWDDEMFWQTIRQHPSPSALPALAAMMAAHARAVLGVTRKVLVTDLDNTLWGGIIAEDGVENIRIGPGSAEGEAHARLQEYLVDLKTRGILLAVASKNNFEDARLPFVARPGMLLKFEDFVAFHANWAEKALNVRAMSSQLSLSLDTFVFLDDSPTEREQMRSQCPEVEVIEPGSSVFDYVTNLDRNLDFFAIALSSEDRVRGSQYRNESERQTLKASSPSLDDFLRELGLTACVVPISRANLTRVAQLINKTNQFNLTVRRYTEGMVQQLTIETDSWAAAFRLRDLKGDYGLVGVILCRSSDQNVWEIDIWLISCRALGRQLEYFMFDRLIDAAQRKGIREIYGVYRPAIRNTLVSDLYENLGFQQISATVEEVRYRLIVPATASRKARFIRDDTSAPPITVSKVKGE